MKPSRDRLTVADLFSGAGGFSLGFRDAGFDLVFAVDIDNDCIETYKANLGDSAVCDAAKRIDVSGIRADVLIGGPPCQPYSLLGKSTDADPRASMTKVFMDCVAIIRPIVFLIENVPGYFRSREAAYAINRAKRLGFKTTGASLNAVGYAVPQRRNRSFLIGSRQGRPYLPLPFSREYSVGEAFTGLSDRPDGANWHKSRSPSEASLERYRCIPERGNRFDLPLWLRPPCWRNGYTGSRDGYGRLDNDRASVTIRTEFVKPEKGRYLHPFEHRPITPREGARLQTFPDTFAFHGSMTSVVRQIGNAVPPQFAYALALAIRDHLANGTSGKKLANGDGRWPFVQTELSSLPHQWEWVAPSNPLVIHGIIVDRSGVGSEIPEAP